MRSPGTDEKIRYMLTNVTGQAGMAGVQRRYDVLFTDTGIAFPVIASGLKMAAAAGLAGGFGAVGAAAAHGALNGSKVRDKFQGLTVRQILELNEKSFFVPYHDVVSIRVKKGLLGVGRMDLQMADGKFQCEFSKDQLQTANAAVAEKLIAKLTT
jgi:hypothetical protein